ncbi:hypothetical protein [Variovorax guangxiensis]|uniref:GNAT superfamily N-acetyltransferase n=1 Tax=Variovorax guangxiensis TaxID=1775474 RepID=A0A840FV02_9BURK|nr:hypothetical protein [Variovorax guangxiensis]MBB4226023.1 GNAT superfamily N-acetyltransferase [Variovorax guangxiensis]
MITFAVEDWFDVRDHMAHLWPSHWAEVAMNRDTIRLEIDFDSYNQHAATGALHIVVARKSGEVIGYHVSLVRPHLHYKSSLSAFTDVYYIAPPHRTGRTPMRLFEFVERSLKARGVEKLFTGTKLSLDAGPLLQHLGWVPTEMLYTKYIGGLNGSSTNRKPT